MDIPPEAVGAFLRPFFWLIALSAVYWIVGFLPEKARRILTAELWSWGPK